MYEFICIQYALGRITEEQVRAFAPQYITAEQAEEIINGTNAD